MTQPPASCRGLVFCWGKVLLFHASKLCYDKGDKSIFKQKGANRHMIRRATNQDIPALDRLLCQVLEVHHKGRPDLFQGNAKKYTDPELEELLADNSRPVFVETDEAGQVRGYAFCILQQYVGHNIMTDIKTLYIDDLCVDEAVRGQHVGKRLYEFVLQYAKEIGCYNVTLNVWYCNESARKFYEACGLQPQKIGMEQIL